ncbi:uncharacterized protein LOC119712636 isoform X5 [Motacilla alba alba]|uniref:uncharacterized protein LOC119712636 isoform X5 n=1 Tax=Motacilla alba alba TaxID=1094192 RepID=UPI0018D4E910|nr:uncharacterized protein LOC119712636 isoform X5 [Motacilla alba alba]
MDAEVRREVGTAERRGGHRTPGEAEATAALPGLLPSGSPGTRPVAPEGCAAEQNSHLAPIQPHPCPGAGTEPWEDPRSPKSHLELPWAGVSCLGTRERLLGVRGARAAPSPSPWDPRDVAWDFLQSQGSPAEPSRNLQLLPPGNFGASRPGFPWEKEIIPGYPRTSQGVPQKRDNP